MPEGPADCFRLTLWAQSAFFSKSLLWGRKRKFLHVSAGFFSRGMHDTNRGIYEFERGLYGLKRKVLCSSRDIPIT